MSWVSQGINDVTQGLGKLGQDVNHVSGQIGQGASGLGNGISSMYNNNKRWFDPLAGAIGTAALAGMTGGTSLLGALPAMGLGANMGGFHWLRGALGKQTYNSMNPGSLSMHNPFFVQHPQNLLRAAGFGVGMGSSPMFAAWSPIDIAGWNAFKRHDTSVKNREKYAAQTTSNFDQSMAGANGVQGSVVNAKTGQDVQNTILGYEQQRQAAQNAYMQSMLSQISGFANIAGMGLGAGI